MPAGQTSESASTCSAIDSHPKPCSDWACSNPPTNTTRRQGRRYRSVVERRLHSTLAEPASVLRHQKIAVSLSAPCSAATRHQRYELIAKPSHVDRFP